MGDSEFLGERSHRKKKHQQKEVFNEDESEEAQEVSSPDEDKMNLKIKKKFKRHINHWFDMDDKIKEISKNLKQYKDKKKVYEQSIMTLIEKLGINDANIDVVGKKPNEIRGRVYRYKSVTKASIKEDTIKDALMEIIRDERKVDIMIKKIDSKRPLTERYYLKKTKGNKTKTH